MQWPLTCWKAKDRHDQQARTTARHYSHSQTGRVKDRHDQQSRIAARYHSHKPSEEPRTGMISKLELQQGTTATHSLESQGQTDQQVRISAGTTATHRLESQGQA